MKKLLLIFLFFKLIYSHTISLYNKNVLNNIHNSILDGNNTTLKIQKPDIGVFIINNCSNLIIKNFSIDYNFLPHIVGKVLYLNKKNKYIIFKPLTKEYLKSLKKNILINKKRFIYSFPLKKPGIVKKNGTKVSIIKLIKKYNQNYKIIYKTLKNNFHKNDIIVIIFRKNGEPIFKIKNSKNITFENIKIFASPAAAFTSINSSNITIKNSKILIKNNRWLSTNAGGIHCQNNRIGPKIINNEFVGLGDDCINLYTKPLYIKKQTKNYITVKSTNYTYKAILLNDIFYFYDPKKDKIIYKAKLLKISHLHKNIIKLTFNKKLPLFNKNILLYDINLSSYNFIIKNNIFENSRRHGVLLKAHNGIIQNNIFKNLGGYAIAMYNSNKNYIEGLNSENIIIKNNIFFNCGFGINKNKAILNKLNLNNKIKIFNNTKE